MRLSSGYVRDYGMQASLYVDSRVVVGAVSKGRSSSQHLNSFLRRLTAVCLGADVSVRLIWVGTKSNPLDAPSRLAPLPVRGPMPAWAQPLWTKAPSESFVRPTPLCAEPGITAKLPPPVPEHSRAGEGVSVPFEQRHGWPRRTCCEYYSGCGRLSAALRRRGFDTVEVETGKDGVVDPDRDMGNAALVDKEIADIEAGKVCFAHIGIVCSSWCSMTMIYNGGTRTKQKPYGNGTLHTEAVGNS